VATKVTDFFYQVSPTESLTFTISGPADPKVFLDNTTITATKEAPFTITPQMLNGMGASHSLNCILLFPAGPGQYFFNVDDQNGNIDQFTVNGPNQGSFTKAEITIEVA